MLIVGKERGAEKMAKEKPQTKVCKHCKLEIPYGAKVCPQCRKKQSGGVLKWILIVVIILAIYGIATGGGGDSDKASNSNPKKVGSESGKAGADAAEEKEPDQAEEKEPENEFRVGDVVETSDLKISFKGAEKYVSDNEFIQPKDGHVYYKMDFEFENISDSDEHVSSWDFKCYADGYDMEQQYLIDGMDLDATLSPGKKTKGAVFFEVPKGSKEITLEYETNFWTEDKVVFIVKKAKKKK